MLNAKCHRQGGIPIRRDKMLNSVVFTFYFLLFTFYFLPTRSFARLGGCSGAFLSIGGGTRALALGGAYSAFAEGIDAIYWNPAGIAKLSSPMVNFVHINLFPGADISQENLAFTVPVKGGAIGISTIAFLSGDMEMTTDTTQQGSPTGASFSANDFAVGISYALRMTDKFSAGITIKGINQNIYKTSSNGVVCDIGGTYNTGLQNLRFGFMIQNFGPDVVFSGEFLKFQTSTDTLQDEDVNAVYSAEPDPLPLSFQMGVAMDVLSTPMYKIALTSDLVHLSDQDATYALGTELSMQDKYFVRLGYTEKNTGGLTCGVGIAVQKIIIDYTYQVHKYLSGVHRIGLSFIL